MNYTIQVSVPNKAPITQLAAMLASMGANPEMLDKHLAGDTAAITMMGLDGVRIAATIRESA